MFHFILGLQNLDLLSVGIAVAGMITLGFTVLFNDLKNVSNRVFFFLAISASMWGIVNYLFYQPHSVELSIWLLRFVMFFGVLSSFFTFTFAYFFHSTKVKFPIYYKLIIIPFTVIVMALTLTPLLFSEVIDVDPEGRIARVNVGKGILLFAVLVLFLNFGGMTFLIRKATKCINEERKALQIVLLGFILMVSLIIVFNFILPVFFDNPRFTPLGALFMFPFIAFTSYSILRYKLFNIRVAGTAVLVFLLSVVTFSEVILARDVALIIYRSGIFLLVLSFGILLIRGVLKEVEQKEKLTELNKKLQLAYEEVDRLSKAKSEFISIASHQLRTPLSAIKGYISMILEGTYGKINEKAIRPIENVYKSNERLIKLVNDLLSISRIEAGRMDFNVVETQIEEVIEEVISMLKINVEKKGLYLKFEKPAVVLPKLLLDRDKIREVILNLIDNSIKYTKEGGVNVSLETAGDKLRVIVKDTGEGMTKDDLNKVFETFSRGSVGIKSHTEGAGLGLYIAKKFVEMHKGKIWAESEGKGRGSTFFVELPFSG